MDGFHARPVHFFRTPPHTCSYLENRLARSEVVVYPNPLTVKDYSKLIRCGFRRSGNYVYRPACDACHACIAVRIVVDQFTPNRTQKRIEKQYASLIQRVLPCEFDSEHYELYLRYQRVRHTGGSMDRDDVDLYLEFLESTMGDHVLFEFRSVDGMLKMVSLVDVVEDGLSAVYTFFDPDNPKDSLGTYGILSQVNIAKQLGLPYVYLGYWIEESPKMVYKSRFSGLECLEGLEWVSFKDYVEDTPTNF